MEAASERLKKLRLEKGLSLEEVQKKTKIQLNILRALEGDSITNLNPVYLQGFLKIYCKFLGVDPKDYSPGYKEAPARPISAPPVKEVSDNPKSEPLLKTASVKLGSFRPSEALKRNILLVVLAIFVLVGLFKLGQFISSKRKASLARREAALLLKAETKKEQKAKPATKPITKPLVQEAKPQAKSTTTPQNIATAQGSAAARKDLVSEIMLVIKARENCWVTLKADGRVVFHRVLEKGRSESWKAKERMELSLGNSGVVELEVNGQLFPNLGRKGQALKNIVITKKGMEIK